MRRYLITMGFRVVAFFAAVLSPAPYNIALFIAAALAGLAVQGHIAVHLAIDLQPGRLHLQQRQGLAIIEPFPRHVFVRHGMRHHEYHHGSPKIMHIRSNPHRAADGGKTAVGCHQQTAAQACAIVQLQLRALVVAVGLDDLLAAHQRDVAVLGHAILHTVISCLADQVIG